MENTSNTITVTQCTLVFTGEELITVMTALQELPFKRVAPLLTKIETQIQEQYKDKIL